MIQIQQDQLDVLSRQFVQGLNDHMKAELIEKIQEMVKPEVDAMIEEIAVGALKSLKAHMYAFRRLEYDDVNIQLKINNEPIKEIK